jgi:hypothetical protein
MTELLPLMAIAVPLFVAVVVWVLNERSRRAWEEYRRKEERYRELLRTVQGFMVGGENEKLKREFVAVYYECWLYAPDSVIQHLRRFLRRLHVQSSETVSSEELLAEVTLAARRDLLSRKSTRKTQLTAADFELFGVAHR